LSFEVLQQRGACASVVQVVTKLTHSERGVVAVGYQSTDPRPATVIADIAGNWSDLLLGPTGVVSLCGLSAAGVAELFRGIDKHNEQHLWPPEMKDYTKRRRALQAGQERPLGFELEGCLSRDVYTELEMSWAAVAAATAGAASPRASSVLPEVRLTVKDRHPQVLSGVFAEVSPRPVSDMKAVTAALIQKEQTQLANKRQVSSQSTIHPINALRNPSN